MATRVRGGAPLKVLFIGNSFTARNDLPGLLARLAEARGKGLEHRLISAGGASLRTHWNAGEARKAIEEGRYDRFVLDAEVAGLNGKDLALLQEAAWQECRSVVVARGRSK